MTLMTVSQRVFGTLQIVWIIKYKLSSDSSKNKGEDYVVDSEDSSTLDQRGWGKRMMCGLPFNGFSKLIPVAVPERDIGECRNLFA